MSKKKRDKRADGSIRRRYRAEAIAKWNKNGGTCWLCGGPIDLNRKFPDPLSLEADHVIPVSVGGHVLGRVEPAHRICNIRRGNKTRGLIGPTSRDW